MVYAGRARASAGRVGRGGGRRRGGAGWRDVYAALDLGTNNCRLLVARPAPEGFRVIDAFSRIVRLGEGIVGSGHLGEAAMVRTLEALRVCAAKMRRRRVTRVRAVATEACRRAGNCQQFLERTRRETGLELEIITARQEAELALIGCAPLLEPALPQALVFDIGGGSTEVAWLQRAAGVLGDELPSSDWTLGAVGPNPDNATLRALVSLPFGVVTLAERYGPATGETAGYRAIVEEVYAALAPLRAEAELAAANAAGRLQMLGTSGTVTTLAGVHLGLLRYDRAQVDGSFLDFATIERVTADILAMSLDGRASHPCIGRDRADLVAAGCAILEAICRAWPVGRLRVADRGVREGILLSLMRRASEPEPPALLPRGQEAARP